jgi:transcriptional regulator with XRE-family HTH domain
MKPKDVMRDLLDRTGENPNSLATKTGVAQSSIQRMLASDTKEPRRSTLEPIARYYGFPVECFFSGLPEDFHPQNTQWGKGLRSAGSPTVAAIPKSDPIFQIISTGDYLSLSDVDKRMMAEYIRVFVEAKSKLADPRKSIDPEIDRMSSHTEGEDGRRARRR